MTGSRTRGRDRRRFAVGRAGFGGLPIQVYKNPPSCGTETVLSTSEPNCPMYKLCRVTLGILPFVRGCQRAGGHPNHDAEPSDVET